MTEQELFKARVQQRVEECKRKGLEIRDELSGESAGGPGSPECQAACAALALSNAMIQNLLDQLAIEYMANQILQNTKAVACSV